MNTLRKTIVLSVFSLACIVANAQNGLHIEQIFNEYGKQEGSILIELAKDVLGHHTRINYYKSLIITSDTEIQETIEKAVQADLEKGNIIVASQTNGKMETVYCNLEKCEESTDYEYILFKSKSKKLTLIYLKGNFPPDQLDWELNELKNLFIKVNNKQIKL
ncbi:MAG: hypothetical protein LBN71_09160 [Tannerella sp.]|jgi:hypothetical protein|nr:hypothetical protein [Tannerella sp.]